MIEAIFSILKIVVEGFIVVCFVGWVVVMICLIVGVFTDKKTG